MSPEELREQGNASVRRLIEEHTDQSLLKTFDRSLREFERAASAPSAHMLRPRRRELCSAAGTEPVRCLRCFLPQAPLRASSALSTAMARARHALAPLSPARLRHQSTRAAANLPQTLHTPYPPAYPPVPAGPSKGGRKVRDPTSSVVPDASSWPTAKEFEKEQNFGVVTAW